MYKLRTISEYSRHIGDIENLELKYILRCEKI